MTVSPLKILFAGTPSIAATALEKLLTTPHQLLAVYTQPDRPAGRGRSLMPSPVKQLALAHGLAVEQPLSLKDEAAQHHLASYEADVLIVVAYGLILPQKILDAPNYGCINVHMSLLPRWRGAAPIQRAVLAGDKETGVTIMQMDAGLDTGDILYQTPCAIAATDTSATLHDKLADLGAQALLKTLDDLAHHQLQRRPQPADLATYASKLSKQEAMLDWQRPAEELARAVRGYNPAPMAHTYYQGKLLKIWDATALVDATSAYAPGTICHLDKTTLRVQTGQGQLCLQTLQLPGGKPLTTATLLNGNANLFSIGTTFETSE